MWKSISTCVNLGFSKIDGLTRSDRPFSVFLQRAFVVIALAGICFSFAGCTTLSVERNRSEIMARLPQPHLVIPGNAFEAACLAAAHVPGAQVLYGAGNSMEPLYADGTAVVVDHYDYTKLQPGMAVVYWSNLGYRICHVIIGQSYRGFIMQGLNNDCRDDEYVTPENYIGVITQAFASFDSDVQPVLASAVTPSSQIWVN
jgi:signal peptidase I